MLFLKNAAINTAILATYYALHSLLASDFLKQRTPVRSETYRKFYILFAILTAGLAYGAWTPLSNHYSLNAIGTLISLIGLIGLIWTAKHMDLGVFFGLHSEVSAKLTTNGPYRWMRHPTYTFTLCLGVTPWPSRDSMLFVGVTLVYAIVGSSLEEARLIKVFGNSYRSYQKRTSRLIPGII